MNKGELFKEAINYLNNNDIDNAIKYFEMLDDSKSYSYLAELYMNNLRCKDYDLAYKYALKGSNLGNHKSKYFLSLCYLNGFGVKQNIDTAAKLAIENMYIYEDYSFGLYVYIAVNYIDKISLNDLFLEFEAYKDNLKSNNISNSIFYEVPKYGHDTIYFIIDNNVKYCGYIKDKKPNSNGVFIYKNGSYFQGKTRNGLFYGNCKFVYSNGNIYIGGLVGGKKYGKGEYYWNNGNHYIGDFVNDLRTGKGEFYWSNVDHYKGDFVNDLRTGKGEYYWNNGEYYKGDFLNGKMHGKGVLHFKNGNVYYGDFVNDSLTGKGSYKCTNGDEYYGDFINGIRTGKGSYRWTNGDSYDGDFKNGKRTGKGWFRWNNGDSYRGDFIDGIRTGQGTYYWNDGDYYVGGFCNNKRDGEGAMYHKGGRLYLKGIWKNGERIKTTYDLYKENESSNGSDEEKHHWYEDYEPDENTGSTYENNLYYEKDPIDGTIDTTKDPIYISPYSLTDEKGKHYRRDPFDDSIVHLDTFYNDDDD